jgi:hypothetical protein
MEKLEPLETLDAGVSRAWRLDRAGALRAHGKSPEHDAAVASWIVQAPWAHPVWHSYWIHIIHLRPIDRGEGPVPTTFYLPGASHELWLHALNPDLPLEQMIAEGMVSFLTPMNFAAQLILADDAAAEELARTTVQDVLAGRLNPDTDAVEQWFTRFGDNMRRVDA